MERLPGRPCGGAPRLERPPASTSFTPLGLPCDDMEDVPVLGIAARRHSVVFFLLEHLEVKAVEPAERLVAADEGHARPAGPCVLRPIPLTAEPSARGQRLADAFPQAMERLGFAKRHGEARIHQLEAE